MFWYPHIKDGGAGSANYSFGSRNARPAYCEKCAGAYRLLDLSCGASKEEVKRKKWAFAELFSADRLRTMSEQARQLAEEKHKSINAACDQILRCPECKQLRDDLDGSASRPAPCQPKSARPEQEESKPQRESKPQPDKYSLAEQVVAILKETQNKIDAVTFVREQTGWDLKEAMDFVDSIAPQPDVATGQEESNPQPGKCSQAGCALKEAVNFVDSIALEWHPAPERAAGATAKQRAFCETSPGKFSVRMVILVLVLVAGTLAGWNLYSRHKIQMETEKLHLYQEQQHQQKELQRERVKDEQLRRQEEACAEKSAARRMNSANRGSRPLPANSSLMPQQSQHAF